MYTIQLTPTYPRVIIWPRWSLGYEEQEQGASMYVYFPNDRQLKALSQFTMDGIRWVTAGCQRQLFKSQISQIWLKGKGRNARDYN
jgi:hypothetical protein